MAKLDPMAKLKQINWTEHLGILIVLGVGFFLAVLLITVPPQLADPHAGHNHGAPEPPADGGVAMDDDVVESAGVGLESTGPATLKRVLRLRGRIVVNGDRHVPVSPRFPGTVVSVHADLGQNVSRGALLATVESSQARSTLEVRSGIDGTIVDRHAVRGAYANEREPLFVIVDLASVWAELQVADKDVSLARQGAKLRIKELDGEMTTEATVSYITPHLDPDTQSALLRAIIPNPDRAWRPGTFIEAELETAEKAVPIAVLQGAIQSLDGETVVFVRHEDHFEPRIVELGASDRTHVEIVKGLAADEKYAAGNSFIVKAELLKSTAEHSH